jgi:hypothetical protein
MALQSFVGPWPWTGDQPVPTHRTSQIQNKRTQTSMPRVEFEPTTPAFERAKTVHALDRAVTVIGGKNSNRTKMRFRYEIRRRRNSGNVC